MAGLLQAMGRADTDIRLSDLTMLDAGEQQHLQALPRPDWSVPDTLPYVASAFETMVTRYGDRTAVTEAPTGHSVDFRTLDQQADALATRLVECGIGPQDVVAIALPRSGRQIAAMLATLKARASFLLLDLDQPLNYLTCLIRQAKAIVVPHDMPTSTAAPKVMQAADACQAHSPLRPLLDADSSAYFTFTADSTWTSNAVLGLSSALSPYASWRNAFLIGSTQRLLDVGRRHGLAVLSLHSYYGRETVADRHGHPRPMLDSFDRSDQGWTSQCLPGKRLSILEPGNVGVLADYLRRLLPPTPTAILVKEP